MTAREKENEIGAPVFSQSVLIGAEPGEGGENRANSLQSLEKEFLTWYNEAYRALFVTQARDTAGKTERNCSMKNARIPALLLALILLGTSFGGCSEKPAEEEGGTVSAENTASVTDPQQPEEVDE